VRKNPRRFQRRTRSLAFLQLAKPSKERSLSTKDKDGVCSAKVKWDLKEKKEDSEETGFKKPGSPEGARSCPIKKGGRTGKGRGET